MKWWLIVVVLIVGCGSNPLTSNEEEFLGTWVTEFHEEDGTKVRIVWTFGTVHGDRTVRNEIHRGDVFIRLRKGQWQVLESARLRVVLESENLTITDHYDSNPEEISILGELIGGIIGDILRAETNDEFTIDYIRDGDVLRMKWYNDEYQTYVRMDK